MLTRRPQFNEPNYEHKKKPKVAAGRPNMEKKMRREAEVENLEAKL